MDPPALMKASYVEILKGSDLDLKLFLETFKSTPFELETFLKLREEYLNQQLSKYSDDYLGIITVIVRGMFADVLRQAFTLFNDKSNTKEIFQFTNQLLFQIIQILRSNLKKSGCDRSQLIHMWHSTILAGEALKPFSADFSAVLNDIFVNKMVEIIKTELNEHLSNIGKIEFIEEIDSKAHYDLNTTIALNSVVDAINQVRLCPPNSDLREKIMTEIRSRAELTENIKQWAINQF